MYPETEQLRKRVAELDDAIERMAPVVRAANAWRDDPAKGLGSHGAAALTVAVDAYRRKLAGPAVQWISWEQTNPERSVDGIGAVGCRPITWPPPVAVLAFWESGFGDNCSLVVALVVADTEAEAQKVVRGAWEPGVSAWRFCRKHDMRKPPGDRFPAPQWSLEMGRWPWK